MPRYKGGRPMLAIGLALLVPAIAGCAGSEVTSEAGSASAPSVAGMNLVTAEKVLEDANYAYTEVAEDGMFGIVNPNHWTVCRQMEVSDHLIELTAAKRGCQ